MISESNLRKIGSDWDHFLSALLQQDVFQAEAFKFKYEVKTMEMLYNIPSIRLICEQWLDSIPKYTTRDNTTDEEINSLYYRELGNSELNNGKEFYSLAVHYYNCAIRMSDFNSEDFALAHANRAVPLMSMELYKEALNDCELAKQNNYPFQKLEKVLHRQAYCAVKLKDPIILNKILKEFKELDRKVKTKICNKPKFKEYEIELKKLSNLKVASEIHCQRPSDKLIFEKYKKSKGRYIVAGEEINVNEIIQMEKAFAFVPAFANNFNTTNLTYVCQNCAKVNIIPFFCLTCKSVTYCSPECLNFHKNLHEYECAGSQLDLWSIIGIAYLSLRTLLCGFKSLTNILIDDGIKNTNSKNLFEKILAISEQNQTFRYGNVIRLVTNFDQMEYTDFMKYSLTAVMLTIYLKSKTNFFDEIPSQLRKIMNQSVDWELLVASLLMRHVGQLICNGHAITDLVVATTEGSPKYPPLYGLHIYFKIERVFTAIFPNISLLNHSCSPNIFNRFNNDELTVSAIKKISENEEIFNCYGPNYKLMDNSSRIAALKQQYNFFCDCIKCKDTDRDFDYYICTSYSCNNKIYLEENLSTWYRSNESVTIICNKCTNKLDLSWYNKHNNIVHNDDLDPLNAMNVVIKLYNKSKKNLSKYHIVKEDMLHDIISRFISISFTPNLELHYQFTQLVLEYIDMIKERYTELSQEYIISCTYLLDIMAFRKSSKLKQIENGLKFVEHFSKVLSNQAQEIFENYLKLYINCE